MDCLDKSEIPENELALEMFLVISLLTVRREFIVREHCNVYIHVLGMNIFFYLKERSNNFTENGILFDDSNLWKSMMNALNNHF